MPAEKIGWISRDGAVIWNATAADLRRMDRDDQKHDTAWWSQIVRVGKKAAGRALDGVTHDARPEVRRVA